MCAEYQRSNFEIPNLQGKEDFIATCKKYFRNWCETNQNNNSFNNPIFNDFAWKAEVGEKKEQRKIKYKNRLASVNK